MRLNHILKIETSTGRLCLLKCNINMEESIKNFDENFFQR